MKLRILVSVETKNVPVSYRANAKREVFKSRNDTILILVLTKLSLGSGYSPARLEDRHLPSESKPLTIPAFRDRLNSSPPKSHLDTLGCPTAGLQLRSHCRWVREADKDAGGMPRAGYGGGMVQSGGPLSSSFVGPGTYLGN